MSLEASTNDIVLVVDDHEPTRRAISALLRHSGYDVRNAPSGHAALRLLTVLRPNIVILDLALPGIDGVEVFQWVRQSPALRDIPVLVLSGDADYLAAARQIGVTACLTKGRVSWQSLLRCIQQTVMQGRYGGASCSEPSKVTHAQIVN